MIALTKILGPWVKKEGQKKLFKVRKQLEEVAMDFCSAITFRLGNSIHKVCTIVHFSISSVVEF